ncbi:MAG: DUF3943 domain-containing protein [Epsilonproteobacteria bacterium]|nr:DUF3943 domain-containing protein [Campylobacterota bacterium]
MKKLVFSFFLFITVTSAQTVELYTQKEDILSSFKQYQLKKNFLSLDENCSKDYIPYNLNLNNLLTTKEKKLFNDTAYLQVFMLGTVLFLYTLPPSITKWEEDPEDTRTIWEKWRDHVKEGPVWDEDEFAINYIGHPVSGAWYYMIAREDGYTPFESFVYSFCLSTFFWEYGYEAFAEIPSIQDLIFTPGIGAFMGEGFWYLQNMLDANGGMIWGSKTLGNISYFFLNPIKRITDSMDHFFDLSVTFRYQVYQPHIISHISPLLQQRDYVPQSYGFMLDIQF